MVPYPQELKENSREPLSLPETLDHMFNDVKDTDKETEDGSLYEGGINQGFVFQASTEADHISDHDDFCENQGFDQSHPLIRVRDTMGSQNESSVLGKSSEHEGEINNNYPVLGHLMEDFFLQAPFFLIKAVPDSPNKDRGGSHASESDSSSFFHQDSLSTRRTSTGP
jgi:hypothetical protein